MIDEFRDEKKKDVAGGEAQGAVQQTDRGNGLGKDIEERHGQKRSGSERNEDTKAEMADLFEADGHQSAQRRGRDGQKQTQSDQSTGA